MPLWMHTHDTASMAVACYMAAIEGGADGVDLSVRPMASGTVQPDARSLDHALKGTGYSLNFDVSKLTIVEELLNEGLKDYAFNPTTTTADARVLGFPMPGGAIGPNVHMMVKAGILEKYSEVLAEFPIVVEAGGAWTSVTPGSQQYWLQAFNNVMYGRWEKIEAGYGRAILGYFGKTPLPPDPEVIKKASEQLELPVFDGDPLEAAPKNIEPAKKVLQDNNIEVNDVNTFVVLAAMVPGKKVEVNEGLKLLMGKGKIDIPLKKKEEPAKTVEAVPASATPTIISQPVKNKCIVEENGSTRTFNITIEPIQSATAGSAPTISEDNGGVPVFSTFSGSVDVVDILVKAGDRVIKGQVIVQVEAMKAKHDIKAPKDGTIQNINIAVGDEIDNTKPMLTIS